MGNLFVGAVGLKSFNSIKRISFSSQKENGEIKAVSENDSFTKQEINTSSQSLKENKHKKNASSLIFKAVITGAAITAVWVLIKYLIYKAKR